MFKRMLIANRGEIAMRILRCCVELGIETVLIHSTEDAESMPVQLCTQAVCIGPAATKDSYLNVDAILTAAKAYACDAIHPGFGFLSENAEFAEKCEENGLVFVGPSAEIIRKMGDKQSARELMKKHGVPVVPGSDGLVEDAKEAAEIAKKTGYPVLIKASAGGGGRGMRTAFSEDEIEQAFESARAEAKAAFGDGSMYLEKLIVNPRHIEVQILGDRFGHIVQLGERDCSMQRRNQKLIEEAPAKCLTPKSRQAIAKAALKAAKAAGYYSVGTVEFVLDQDGHFYFIEMNTRIQVEHPVTEMVTGIDLIREQIRVAAGQKLSMKQDDIKIHGHAIECRINAENPEKGFAPSPGTVDFLHLPGGCGVRVESALYQGCQISPWYDSMAAKIIVHAPGRLEAIRRMRMALEETVIEGIDTNIDFLLLIMFNPDYMLGNINTSFIENHTQSLLDWNKASKNA
ncbi:MAG: acetyl-CoA carboxylase biotin carboxylase subunit [Lachnospiraceae bacterium]|nr:acetyl-CoA carboxylase biotin carboxylase subunit [Lachnospiraceae bacterium]